MKQLGRYVCGAGVTHYERQSVVDRWFRNDQERAAWEAADKVRAHDDYMEAIRRFRSLAATRETDLYSEEFKAGYRFAVRDMDEALLDAMAARAPEEEE